MQTLGLIKRSFKFISNESFPSFMLDQTWNIDIVCHPGLPAYIDLMEQV